MENLSIYTPDSWCENENEYNQQLKNEKFWEEIPLMNSNELHDLRDGMLIRFRGMVQDMYNPEYYFERYEVVDEDTYEKSTKNGKYCDSTNCKDKEVVNIEGGDSITNERHTYFAISPPGLNSWVIKIEEEKYKLTGSTDNTDSSNNRKGKRLHEDDEKMEEEGFGGDTHKKICSTLNNTSVHIKEVFIAPEDVLNFPLKDRIGKACHLKIYDNTHNLKLNELYEFVGFLSTDPAFAFWSKNEDNVNPTPPTSLIPRIHCITWKPFKENNPLIDNAIKTTFTQEKMQNTKKELHILFTQLLLGDKLAAEYLIYHLISEVYSRADFLSLGKFSLNISKVPVNIDDYVKEIYNFIELLVTKSHYFTMTLDNMNNLAFSPRKDYAISRLRSGVLQLSDNTHFVVDETKLQPGKLNEAGVKNVAALARVIKDQKILYDFGFYELAFDCDIPCLIMSEGKSMLPNDVHVPLNADETLIKTFAEIIQAAKHFLKPELLTDIRIFLSLSRKGKYDISDDMNKIVQDDFVKMRKNDNSINGDNLHQLLVLARLICLSDGKSTLDSECWKKACSLESERLARLPK